MWPFFQYQGLKSYQKETGVIKKIWAAGEDFAELLISLVAGGIELLLDIEDLAFQMRVVVDSVGHLFIGITDGCRASIA